ncbi:MAG: DUF6497 family protein [Rhodobacter sp.]|nr:DUF6497 family protein [Rhodobacter sp.]
MRALPAIFVLCAAPASALDIAVPSGQPITFVEVISDIPGPSGTAYRYRFVAPEIARDTGSVAAEAAAADIDALCNGFVLPGLAGAEKLPEQVIISLSDRPVPFGEPAPGVTQFFESYRIENGTCIWEEF